MHQPRSAPAKRTLAVRTICVVVVVAVAALGLVAVAPAARTVKLKTAQNATLHRKVLVTSRGHTLYALSAEHGTHFVCIDRTCRSLWKPLALPKGATATGVKGLGKVTRPDGKVQVTYHGHPLYTFTRDKKAGDAKGEGFKDVGTWHAVTVGKKPAAKQPAPQPQPPQPTPPYPGYPTY